MRERVLSRLAPQHSEADHGDDGARQLQGPAVTQVGIDMRTLPL